jgi:NTE family protein
VTLHGLVLTGGGARAAYQAGALRALAELLGPHHTFPVIAGVSAGAINAAALAARAGDFRSAAHELCGLWAGLQPESVYRTDVRSLARIGSRWIRDIAGGGLLGRSGVNHLLDTSPLRGLLTARLGLERLPARLADGSLRGLAVTATSYATGTALSFFDGAPDLQPWARSTRIGVRETITLDHVMASAAIPVFFPPVTLRGSSFGDGCVRMSAPLSPAIHMGADRIIAIGIRFRRPTEEVVALNAPRPAAPPRLSDIAGLLLNAVFLDSLETDLERVNRINRTLALVAPGRRDELALRPVPVLALQPSQDLGKLAAQQYSEFPRTLRHLLAGIGATGDNGWDLVSYLAFEPVYLGRLLDLGYADTMARAREVEAFVSAG